MNCIACLYLEGVNTKMIQLLNVNKRFEEKIVLSNVSLAIGRNEFVCIIGESGAGKTTLLNIIGLLEKPDSGEVILNGKKHFAKKDILRLRRDFFGYVFQDYLLLPDKTVEENIYISMYKNKKVNKKEIAEAMKKVGLNNNYLNKKVYYLSGGEQQKVAIARMLLKEYELVLADEPTGNLDSKNSEEVMALLSQLNAEGTTIVMVTHSQHDATYANRVINLLDGAIVDNTIL